MTTFYDYGYQAPSTSAPAYRYGAASSSVPSVTTTLLMAMDAAVAGSLSPSVAGAPVPLASRLAGAPLGGGLGTSCHWGDVALALALSCGAGVRATLPAFLLSCCHLMDPEEYTLSGYARFLQLGRPEVCAALGVLLALEIAADHIPSVDHALHTVLLPIHPLMGAFAAIAPGYCGGWYARVPMAVVGSALAFGVHSGKALVRMGVGGACCGMLNPLVSHCETLFVSALMLLSVNYPEAALATDVLFVYLGYLGVSGSDFLLRSAYRHLAALKAPEGAAQDQRAGPDVEKASAARKEAAGWFPAWPRRGGPDVERASTAPEEAAGWFPGWPRRGGQERPEARRHPAGGGLPEGELQRLLQDLEADEASPQAQAEAARGEVERILSASSARAVLGGGTVAECKAEFRRLGKMLHPTKGIASGERALRAVQRLVEAKKALDAGGDDLLAAVQ
mmetsp:Transcript_82105/g.232742  ORF Transcript_82105/g.232742 Transcript_82105/m.232742 type:complete len:450 (+) Transcript_82105:50-1399(+)